jgi:hypothetical protein
MPSSQIKWLWEPWAKTANLQHWKCHCSTRHNGFKMLSYEWVQISHRYTEQGIKERKLLLILWHIDIQGGTVYVFNWKSLRISDNVLSNDNLINEESTKQDVRGSSDKPKIFSELHQERYVPRARSRVSRLQTSALQLSLDKTFVVIRSNFVPSLS